MLKKYLRGLFPRLTTTLSMPTKPCSSLKPIVNQSTVGVQKPIITCITCKQVKPHPLPISQMGNNAWPQSLQIKSAWPSFETTTFSFSILKQKKKSKSPSTERKTKSLTVQQIGYTRKSSDSTEACIGTNRGRFSPIINSMKAQFLNTEWIFTEAYIRKE